MKLLGISDSLRSGSTNSTLLRCVQNLVHADCLFEITQYVELLPLFSPDLDPNDFPVVGQWTEQVREADGLVVSTPEYARGYPGALKNAFDWLVGGDGFVEKPYCFLHASARSSISHETLSVVLDTMSGVHAADADCVVPLLGSTDAEPEVMNNPEYRELIQRSVAVFSAAIVARRAQE